MNITSQFSEDGKIFTISIKGSFDFFQLNDFRDIYSDEDIKTSKVVIDMRDTETIDSSALGMLLNMQRHLQKEDGDISIINCNDVVGKIFSITHFSKKFDIQ